MEKALFLKIFKSLMEDENLDLNFESKFEDIEVWDSLTILLVLSEFNDKFDKTLTVEKLEEMVTINEIYYFYNE